MGRIRVINVIYILKGAPVFGVPFLFLIGCIPLKEGDGFVITEFAGIYK